MAVSVSLVPSMAAAANKTTTTTSKTTTSATLAATLAAIDANYQTQQQTLTDRQKLETDRLLASANDQIAARRGAATAEQSPLQQAITAANAASAAQKSTDV